MILSVDDRFVLHCNSHVTDSVVTYCHTYFYLQGLRFFVFSVLKVSMAVCNMSKHAIPQNVAHIVCIDLYGEE